jgi:uncharacterized protein
MSSEKIKQAEQFVKSYLSGAESGHNWWHIYRVRSIAMHIFSKERKGDPFIIEITSLLHEIGDYKVKQCNEASHLMVFLGSLRLKNKERNMITYIIDHLSFRASFGPEYEHMPELDIVQDADRLDAMGAIGIARAFNYGGSRGLEIYDPDKAPKKYKSPEEYIGSDSSTISHFYEKLLKLKDMMNTDTGKKLAAVRHRYMEHFLKQFQREWNAAFSTFADMDL